MIRRHATTARTSLLSGLILLLAGAATAQTLVARSSTWRYSKGTAEASDPRSEWREYDFEDSAWIKGQGPLGYGETSIATTFTDMQGRYSTFFLRRTFTVAGVDADSHLFANVDYDDGFVVWINGERVLEENGPDNEPLHDSLASGDHESGIFEEYELPDPDDYLDLGENVVAVQVFNSGLDSSDCKFDIELILKKRVGDTKFSHDRGFYDASFYVTISTRTAGATIRYTTDGAPPTSGTGTAAGTNAVVQIAKTTCLRAAAYKGGYDPSDVDTQTYIFLNSVLGQTRPSGYPAVWGSVTDGIADMDADYNMDPDIVNSTAYKDRIKNDLKAIPTLSVVMDRNDMFHSATGIYRNRLSGEPSEPWTRACSAELIYPPGTPGDFEGFQIDCAIRPHSHCGRKRSFKLLFTSEYGPTKLRYPFFETAVHHADTATEKFDRIILRAGGNDWLGGGPMPPFYERGSYLTDQWARDSQTAMSGAGSRGTFVHLYINGMYWGLYNPSERTDASWASEYFGGEKEDWFAINHGGAISGDPSRFNYLHANYSNYGIVGDYMDMRQFCDYLVLYCYNAGGDWPNNNWYAGNRVNPPGPVQYYVWDCEDSWIELNQANYGHSYQRSNDGAWVHPALQGTCAYASANSAQVSVMWRAIKGNANFKTEMCDSVYRHCYNGGALTEANSQARWDALCAFVDGAVVGESARWGRYGNLKVVNVARPAAGPPNYETYLWKRSHWQAIVAQIRGFMSGNVAELNTALQTHGIYPGFQPPSFQQHGGAMTAGFRLTMSKAVSNPIYYTLDGSDPRKPGGTRLPTALEYTGPITLSRTTHVKARIWKTNATWSGVHEATFNYTAHYSKIRITEIMYNPLGGSDYEFVEITNTGTSTRGLSEMAFKGITYTFPPGTDLAAGQSLVLVQNQAAFSGRHPGVSVFGQYFGRLDNGGERLALLDNEGRTVTSVRYNDKDPWPQTADGDGYSLVPVDSDGDQDDPAKWRASNLIGGSPGYDDGAPYRVLVNEALTHTDLPQVDAIELHNAGEAGVSIGGWYLSDTVTDYKKFQIPATTLPAGGYVVFDESDFNSNPGSPSCFALDSHGDELYLTKWDASGNLQYLAEARFGGAANGIAFGRYVTSDGTADFVAQSVSNTLGGANAQPAVGPVVINEVMYHPPAADDEFVELLNISDSTVKLYDAANPANTWKLSAAVNYAFPTGTELAPGEYLLVAATNAATFRSRYGVSSSIQVFGPYAGRLGNGGESLKLWRPDAPDPDGIPWLLVDRVNYNDNSPWPEIADGDGPSLERQDAAGYGNDPANWAASLSAGGTPGAPNSGGLVSQTAGWKYHDTGIDLGTAWRSAAHDDASWQDGNAPLGYGHLEIDTEVAYGDNPENKHITTYFRKTFTLGAEPAQITNLTLRARYDDGFIAYVNGQEVARKGLSGTVTYDTTAASHDAAGFEPVDLLSYKTRFVKGRNVLAVELHQSGATSSDLFIDMELSYGAETVQLDIPAKPSNLTASAASQTRINVSWQDNSNNETGFKLDRRQSGASDWVRVATTGANVTTFGDTGLPAGTQFYYQIKAYNGDGSSDYSNVADATTQEGPPAAPSSLGASASSTTRINLSWTDNSGNEDGFKIERSPNGSSSWLQIGTVGGDVVTHADTGLAPGTTYYYRVRAYNGSGHSAYSSTASAATPVPSVQFAASSSSGSESVSPASLTVNLSGTSSQTITVNYAATGGSASSGADYTLASGTLNFAAGQTSKSLSLTVIDDDAEEGSETVVVTLSSPSNATLGSRATHTYTISDNDSLFEAYNDLCWASGQISANITTLTQGESGQLVDYNSGSTVPVTLSVTGGGGPQTDQGVHPASGTDAYEVFNGKVDGAGLINYGPDLILTVSGLDPSLEYEFVLYGNRGNSAYTDRTTRAVISDAAGFANASSAGATISTTAAADDTTVICNGNNTQNGYVTRYTEIDPGADGDFSVTLSDSATRFYANAVMLKAQRPGTGPTRLDIRIAGGMDDVEENSSGTVYVDSSDIELVDDNAVNQTVGLRFSGVTVPRGAVIQSAYVQFQVDETPSAAVSLTVRAQAADNAAAFTTDAWNVSARGTTSASVSWSPPGWGTAGAAGPDQRTPDLAAVIQEVVNRSGWSSGNAVAVIVTGSGERVAEAYEGEPTGAALLHIEYVAGQAPVERIAKGATWRYRKGTAEASSPAAAWRAVGYDDSGWSSGPAPIGFGSGVNTELGDMQNSYSCVFLRAEFQVLDPAAVNTLSVDADYDDGFVLWLNGEELARVNVAGEPGAGLTFDGVAADNLRANMTAGFSGADMPVLRAGANVVAVQVFNRSLDSGDLLFDLALSATEVQLPAAEDPDQDRLPDAWETGQLGGTGGTATDDTDGDGVSNLEEYIAGTDPDDIAKFLAVELGFHNGNIIASFPTVAASGAGYEGKSRHYALEERAAMNSDLWQAPTGYADIVGAGQPVAYTNTSPQAATYYRARVWLED
ncbi:MAG: lamin tail domain-containing protein [Kiritimatiellae bacterium]|nr:lamin tail domain-containing protein [Kiritimatiellia bacterium]